MITIDNDVILLDYLKGVRLKSNEGIVKFYFSDRTAKTFADDYHMSEVLDTIVNKGFIQVDDNYINPSLVKGFENLQDGRIKVYFPDTTAIVLYLDDDAFEDLVSFFERFVNN
jgi:hypothetical protein